MSGQRCATIAPYVRAVRFPEVTVLVNLRTGAVEALTGKAAQVWSALAATGHEPHPSWGTQESPAALAPVCPTPLSWQVIAAVCLPAVLAIRLLGPRRLRFARLRRLAVEPAAKGRTDELAAQRAVRAVRRVGRLVPARVACLEESVAAMLALRITGYRGDWKYGVATDPVRMHAWVEVNGHPIDEPADITDYTPCEGPT